MDNRRGEFDFFESSELNELFNEEEKTNGFKVGETIEIKQSRFRVQKITKKNLVLKLLKPKE